MNQKRRSLAIILADSILRRKEMLPRTYVRPQAGVFWKFAKRKRALTSLLIWKMLFGRKIPHIIRQWPVRPIFRLRKTVGAWYTIIPKMGSEDPEAFFNYFRMTPELFDYVLRLVKPLLTKISIAEPISPGERLAITLRYLASGEMMKSISYQFLVAPPTISSIIRQTCTAIWEVLFPIVMPAPTIQTWEEVASDFERDWHFPNCFGAIDGKHCAVQAFPNSGSDNFNFKSTHSLVLLALCDASYKFTVVDIGGRGRRSDAGLLALSDFGEALLNKKLDLPPPRHLPGNRNPFPYVIVGDAAFPLTENLMRPYPGEFLSDEKTIFNYRLSRARRIIENTFGIMVARWRVLRKTLIASRITAMAIIKAVVCLHNLNMRSEASVRIARRKYVPPRFVDSYDSRGNLIRGRWREEFLERECCLQPLEPDCRLGPRNYTRSAEQVRQDFTDYFMGPGQVPWQWFHLPNRDESGNNVDDDNEDEE